MKKLNSIFLMLMVNLSVLPLFGQEDSVLLTKNFKFEDGIFLSLNSFQNNMPDYTWDDVKAMVYTNPQSFLTQIKYIVPKPIEVNDSLDLEQIWGLSIAGIPYKRLEKGTLDKSMSTFSALRVRGKICYFSYEKSFDKAVTIRAINPLTGRPFREGQVINKEKVQFEKIMDFDSGEVLDFNLENLMLWTADDAQLQSSLKELTAQEVQQKLFKCLLIYDDRNEVYLIDRTTEQLKEEDK